MGSDERKTGRVEALLEAARAVLAYESFAHASRAIFDQARQLIGARSGYVALLSEDGHENEVLFLEAGGLPCSVDPDLPMPIRGLRAVCCETGKTVFDNNFMDGPWVQYLPEGHVEMKNVMFAPLNMEGKTVGVMGLANKASDFTDEDARLASAFSEFAAVSLYNSRNLDRLHQTVQRLEHSLEQVKTLTGLLPMCSGCKKIRDDEGYWEQVDEYITTHTGAQITHGLCPDCLKRLYPEFSDVGPEGEPGDNREG